MILGVYLHFRNSSRAQSQNRDDYDHDSSSISTLDQVVKQWMVAAAKCDYTTLFKMLRDDPRLAKAKDFTSGYTALHWACKHGNLDLVKLLVCEKRFSAVCLHFLIVCLHFRRASTEQTPTFGLMEATLRCTWHVNLIIKKSLTSWSKLMELILTCVTMLEKRLDSTWLLLGMACITCQMTLLGKKTFGHFYLIFFGTSFFSIFFSFLK